MLLPPVLSSSRELVEARRQFETKVDALLLEAETLKPGMGCYL